jgi:hypothetical protein
MARTSNSGGEGKNKAPKSPVEGKAAKAPAARRTVKPRQAPVAAANDGGNGRMDVVAVNGGDGGPNLAEVQRRAYELYVQRGGGDGRDKEDWFEAERQLRPQH